MRLPAHIRYGLNALLGIAFLVAIGLWFVQTQGKGRIEEALLGKGVDAPGLLHRDPGEYWEGERRLPLAALVADAGVLDSRRAILLEVVVPLTDFLRPGEAMPPEHLLALHVEARAPAMFAGRCAEWQAVLAARCMLLDAGIADRGGNGGIRGDRVELEIRYAFTPAAADPVGGDIARYEYVPTRIDFDLGAERIAPADRVEVLRRALAIGDRACAGPRAQHGNCNVLWYRFREYPNPDGSLRFYGGASLGWIAPRGRPGS